LRYVFAAGPAPISRISVYGMAEDHHIVPFSELPSRARPEDIPHDLAVPLVPVGEKGAHEGDDAPGQPRTEKVHDPVKEGSLQESGEGMISKAVAVCEKDLFSIYVETHLRRAGNSRVVLEIPAHGEFMVPFQKHHALAPVDKTLQTVGYRPVPGI
jgi:hypothetical protein